MTNPLTHVVRRSLANLIVMYRQGNLSRDGKDTLTELFEALKEKGEDVTEYELVYRNVIEEKR